MPDFKTPAVVAGEKATLVAFLEYLRRSVMRKARGVSEADGRRSVVASGTSLYGLVKHLWLVENYWFVHRFAGSGPDLPGPDFELSPKETGEQVIRRYKRVIAQANAIVAACDDLDTPCRVGKPLTLRWVLVHMVEETARHAGHADVIREQIDGTVGR